MQPKLGLSSKAVQDRPLDEVLQIASACGYTGLELFGVPNHVPADMPIGRAREVRQRCDDLGLKVVTLCSYVGGFAESSDEEATAQLETFQHCVDIAAALGCDMIRVWPDQMGRNIRSPRDDHWLRAAHYLRLTADIGLNAGVRVLIENHLALAIDADATLRLIRLVDRPNVVVNFDPGNMFLAGRSYGRDVVLRMGSLIQNVQVKEASREGGTPSASSDPSLSHGGTYDLLLGEGNIDHASYLGALAESNYSGYYMAECHKHPTPELPSDEIAVREYRALKRLLEEHVGGANRV